MIRRERIKTLTSIEEIDEQITLRQSALIAMAENLYPQILSEEIVQLRLRRSELEEDLSNQLVIKTNYDRVSCNVALIRCNWDLAKAELYLLGVSHEPN